MGHLVTNSNSPIFTSIKSNFSYNLKKKIQVFFFKDGFNESHSRWAPKILSPWSDIEAHWEQSSDSLSQAFSFHPFSHCKLLQWQLPVSLFLPLSTTKGSFFLSLFKFDMWVSCNLHCGRISLCFVWNLHCGRICVF